MRGGGTAADPYIIESADDLQNIENNLGAYYELGGDIDASATVGWNGGAGFLPIGDWVNRFTGSLDGRGYTVDSLFINRPFPEPKASEVGVFSYNSGTIQNIHFTNCDFTALTSGGLVFNNYGTITDCSVEGSVTGETGVGGFVFYNYAGGVISECSFEGDANSVSAAAGFAQYNEAGASISECHTNAIVASSGSDAAGFIWSADGVISKCYSEGSVIGTWAAGFVSYNYTTIANCYSRSSVIGSSEACGFCFYQMSATATLEHCYSTGAVSAPTAYGFSETGGIIDDCFWDTETSGQSDGGGGTGKTTAQMKTRGTFSLAGWDFTTIWEIRPNLNDGYPKLGITYRGNPNVDQLIYQHVERIRRY